MADLTLPQTLTLPDGFASAMGEPVATLDEVVQQSLNNAAHRERWKYTKADRFLAQTSEPAHPPHITDELQTGVSWQREPIGQPMPGLDLRQAPEAFARLCFAGEAMRLDITAPVAEPITLVHSESTLPVMIHVSANASLSLIETLEGQDETQQSVWIDIGPSAQVVHSRNALNDARSSWQYLNVRLQHSARYQLNNHALGSGIRRQDLHIIMDGRGADAKLVSAGLVDNKAALDQQITMEHRQPRGRSEQTIHNIVANGGKCTFNGRIHIHKGASGTDAQLSNKNLGKGENAIINTKPELEIYTDDVSCSHGATIGTLSKEALFYLTSRGIDQAAAEALLSRGFLRQCIDGPLAAEALDAMIGPQNTGGGH